MGHTSTKCWRYDLNEASHASWLLTNNEQLSKKTPEAAKYSGEFQG